MRDGFAYLRDTPVPSVTEAKKMLQKDLMEGAGHLTRTRTLTLTLLYTLTLTLTLSPNPNPNPNPNPGQGELDMERTNAWIARLLQVGG